MLPWPHDHGLGGGDIYERRLSWICVRNPYRDGEAVCGASEVDWYRARDMEEEGRAAIGESWCRESKSAGVPGASSGCVPYCARLSEARVRDTGTGPGLRRYKCG